VELIERLWRAAGFADPGPDVAVAAEGSVAIVQSFAAAASLFGEEAVFQLVRVLGSAMARVADAIISAFNVNVAPGAVASDPSGLRIVQANLDSMVFLPMLNEAMDQLLRLHLAAAAREGGPSLEAGYEAQELSVGFADLVGSTALAQQLAGGALGRALGAFEAEASDLIIKHGGRVVKFIGDEIMFVTADPDAAYLIGLELAEAFNAHDVLPPVRVGLARGDVLTSGGDCFGTVVSLAARAAREARPGEVIVAEAASNLPSWCHVVEAAERELKGFATPVVLGRLERSGRR
jgi:class 3 adenylate cyclase